MQQNRVFTGFLKSHIKHLTFRTTSVGLRTFTNLCNMIREGCPNPTVTATGFYRIGFYFLTLFVVCTLILLYCRTVTVLSKAFYCPFNHFRTKLVTFCLYYNLFWKPQTNWPSACLNVISTSFAQSFSGWGLILQARPPEDCVINSFWSRSGPWIIPTNADSLSAA